MSITVIICNFSAHYNDYTDAIANAVLVVRMSVKSVCYNYNGN